MRMVLGVAVFIGLVWVALIVLQKLGVKAAQ